MTVQASVPEEGIVGTERVRDVWKGVLRAAAAAGWNDETLGAADGLKPRTIKSYRIDGKLPPLPIILSLCCAIGPRALNPLLALIGYSSCPLEDADEPHPGAMLAALLPQVAVLGEAAKDGRFCHRDEPLVERAADEIILIVTPVSSAGDAE